ncbi:nuclease [Pleurocapsa sp. CCALA 161]|uniref:thermonuclease family protein n=1 Tax=Pleurocapsa sp. CCALA 161 TaxID=2107688 RepID=UPI000D04BEA4|nr:thermonuclease family protein [Pleurocapsa sp. CCALA 161]PSB12086.1 nuclease [Pleurocapsa sp. CCALA 161]
MKINAVIVCCCLILLFGCNATPEKKNLFSAEVTRVVSGQAVEVILTGTSEVVKLRIEGIDAPDWRQSPWGETAKQKLTELVLGKPIKIEAENLVRDYNHSSASSPGMLRDRYNRIQGHLWQEQTLVSQELIKSGCVLVNDRYPHSYSKLLMESQEYARLLGYGIWNPQQAMRYTPSQFRSMNKP